MVKKFHSNVSFVLSHFLLLIYILESDGIVPVLRVLVCNKKAQNQEDLECKLEAISLTESFQTCTLSVCVLIFILVFSCM